MAPINLNLSYFKRRALKIQKSSTWQMAYLEQCHVSRTPQQGKVKKKRIIGHRHLFLWTRISGFTPPVQLQEIQTQFTTPEQKEYRSAQVTFACHFHQKWSARVPAPLQEIPTVRTRVTLARRIIGRSIFFKPWIQDGNVAFISENDISQVPWTLCVYKIII